MGLFSKKKKEQEQEVLTPVMPPVPSSLRFPEIEEIKNTVMPIQQAYSERQIQMLKPISIPSITQPILPKFSAEEIKPETEALPKKVIREIDEEYQAEPSIARLKEPIFVKIDKFDEALNNFEEIKKRLHESFELLEKIKNIRGKEEEEIEAWEKEIEEIKAKMFELDKELFSKVEF